MVGGVLSIFPSNHEPPSSDAYVRFPIDLEQQLAKDKDRSYVPCERFIKKIDGYEFKTGIKVRGTNTCAR